MRAEKAGPSISTKRDLNTEQQTNSASFLDAIPRLELRDFVSLSMGETRFPLPAAAAAEELAKYNAIAVRNFLDPALLDRVMSMADRAVYTSFTQKWGHIEVENPCHTSNLLSLLMKRAEYLHWLEEIAGCGPITGSVGEIYQIRPAPEDRLDWHTDLIAKDRRLAIVVYLGTAPHEGGEFQLRLNGTGKVLLTHKHLVPGSALIFRVHPELSHRVKPILSGGPRRVYSAWALAADASQPFAALSYSAVADRCHAT